MKHRGARTRELVRSTECMSTPFWKDVPYAALLPSFDASVDEDVSYRVCEHAVFTSMSRASTRIRKFSFAAVRRRPHVPDAEIIVRSEDVDDEHGLANEKAPDVRSRTLETSMRPVCSVLVKRSGSEYCDARIASDDGA